MYCISLEQAIDTTVAGGKAANLAKAGALGLRVPATTVIVRRALERFIDSNGLAAPLLEYLSLPRQGSALEETFARLAAQVRAAPLPVDLHRDLAPAVAALLADAPAGLAVRSSALYEDSGTASFAGVFESSIGVRSVAATLRAVVECWLSGWAPRALRYLERMSIEPAIDAMAVMIQPVVRATTAGVIVTANPDIGDPWEFVVHAVRGLSVDLMSGSGAGDRYRLDWRSGAVRVQDLTGTAPVLTASHLAEIASAARHLDEATAQRVHVEWAMADDLWIVQVRPLTALPPFQSPDLDRLDASEHWQLAPFVLPLRTDVPPGFLTPLYADLSESELWYRYQPEDMALTGIWTREVDVHGYRYADSQPRPSFLDHLTTVEDFESWLARHEAPYHDRWERRRDELAEIATVAQRAMRDARTAAELIPATVGVRDRLWDLNAFGWSGPQALGWLCEAMLRRFLRTVDPQLQVSSLIGGEESYTFALAAALQDLGRSIRDERVPAVFAAEGLGDVLPVLMARVPDCDFLQRYESLCWSFGRTPPSWRQRPPFWQVPWDNGDAAAMRAIRSALRAEGRDVREARRMARRERDSEETRIRGVVAAKAPHDLIRFERIVAWTRYWTQALNDRHGMTVGLLWERELIWSLGVQLSAEGLIRQSADVLLLRVTDLAAYARDRDERAFKRTYGARRQEDRHNRRFAAPARVPVDAGAAGTGHAPSSLPDTGAQLTDTLAGTGFGRGRATGRARIIRALGPAVLDALTADDILVVLDENAFAYTDWHSLLMLVKGVVASARPAHHLTQVAREIGAPVVGHVGSGIGRIKDGMVIQIDAERGSVRIE